MTKKKTEEDPENPFWTKEMFAAARPLREVHPELAEWSRKKLGRPPKEDPTVNLTIRVRKSDLDKLRAKGPGFHTEISRLVHEYAEAE